MRELFEHANCFAVAGEILADIDASIQCARKCLIKCGRSTLAAIRTALFGNYSLSGESHA